MIRLAGVAGALLLASVASACDNEDDAESPDSSPSVTAPETGPLQSGLDGGDQARIQGLVDENCRISFGDTFTNVTGEPVVIRGAEFRSVDGATVLDIVRLPKGSQGVGNPPGYPPLYLKDEWQARKLVGSTIQPGEFVWYVVGLRLEGSTGSVSQFALKYEVDGQQFTAVDNEIFIATADSASCANNSSTQPAKAPAAADD